MISIPNELAMNTFEQMIERGHERICFHQDPQSGLRAIIAIHSTKLGNALGGTRRWHYATEADAIYDVLRLSEGMTYKAAVAGLAMGGAKSVVLLPKPGLAGSESEARAMGRFVEQFDGDYIAAEDVGVNPQYIDWMALETKHVMGGEKVSVGGDPSPHTAHGTLNAMKAALEHLGKPVDFSGLTVAIQGIGHVGYILAQILLDAGAKVIAAEINQDTRNRASSELGLEFVENDKALFTSKCDILAPCALGGVIDANRARTLKCSIIAGAANNVLDDPDEDAAALKNQGILYVPDFVANAGGVIQLSGTYLGLTEAQIERKIADIEITTSQVLKSSESMSSTHAAAIALANQRIAAGTMEAQEQVHAR